ncbi:MAG: DNA-binding protein [Acidimicrobiales bacterium]|nr:DNA-binding protein [Acidimicrobiales bacterium]
MGVGEVGAPFRVLPALSEDNRFFWTSGSDGRLRFLRCQSCGYYLHPPSPRCPRCGGVELAPEPVSGRGTVHSFTVNHQSWDGSPEPYALVLVELAEQVGLRLTSNLVGCPLEKVCIGMDVRVVFEHREPVWFPLFEPDDR